MIDRTDLAAAAQPEQVVAAIAANTADADDTRALAHGGGGDLVSVRTATHNGHHILIRTRYEIEVDGKAFQPHVVVDNAGRVHYHGLPTRDFASMVALVKKAIDVFPDDFNTTEPDDGHHDHGGGHEHGPASPGPASPVHGQH